MPTGSTDAGDVETAAPTSTTHITAIDREGTIAALTTTLLSSFGSRYVLPGTGILMNNGSCGSTRARAGRIRWRRASAR